jgi:hypothetical protein
MPENALAAAEAREPKRQRRDIIRDIISAQAIGLGRITLRRNRGLKARSIRYHSAIETLIAKNKRTSHATKSRSHILNG